MAKIDQDGINEINEKIKNPLESIYDKMEKRGSVNFNDVKDEFDFIYRFLDQINNDWLLDTGKSIANPTPTVTVDGKEYRPIRG